MNYRFVMRQLGLLLLVLSATVLLTAALSWLVWGDGQPSDWHAELALLISGGIGAGGGVLLLLIGRGGSSRLGRREAMLLVALSWLIGAALAGLPFNLWARLEPTAGPQHPFHHFVGCYFEAMSGLTTTGATVLSNIEVLPHSLLFWRALTHWLGGLGIVVLFVAVLPSLGVGGKRLFQFESPGPKQPGVTARIQETARMLWLIYVGLTIAQTVALRLCGMTWFDAICHTFATLATGGFSTHNASVGHYDGYGVPLVIIIFMVIAGGNFGLYYQLLRGEFKRVFQDPELRLYLAILTFASMLVAANVYELWHVSTRGHKLEPNVATAVLHSVFQVVSIQTTTGFCSVDFDLWGYLPKMTLVLLMFVGGCAGSTGGGIKVIRLLIGFKVILSEIRRVFRPQAIVPVRVGHSAVDADARQNALVYILLIVLLALGGGIALMILEAPQRIDFTTALTASIATLNNIGPGLARVGAIQNFGWFSPPSLIVMSLLMALGRLEVFVLAVLCVPSFWRTN